MAVRRLFLQHLDAGRVHQGVALPLLGCLLDKRGSICWVCLTGEWLQQLKPLTVKKHERRAKRLFRYGFDHHRTVVLKLGQKMEQFSEVLQFLSCNEGKSVR